MILDDESSSSESETADGLLWEYPEPFKANYGDNVQKFIEKVNTAFNYNRLPASSKVTVLKRLFEGGHAEWSVYDWESFDDNVECLKNVFCNPYDFGRRQKMNFCKGPEKSLEIGPILFHLKEKRCYC